MITIDPIPTPQQHFKALYRIVRGVCSSCDIHCSISIVDIPSNTYYYNLMITDLINSYTQKHVTASYGTTLSHQLKEYMLSYAKQRIEEVSQC